MQHEQTKRLSNREFKRLVGVQRRTFDEMVAVMQQSVSDKQTRGCPESTEYRKPSLGLFAVLAGVQDLLSYRSGLASI
jgi:hypothetical protein